LAVSAAISAYKADAKDQGLPPRPNFTGIHRKHENITCVQVLPEALPRAAILPLSPQRPFRKRRVETATQRSVLSTYFRTIPAISLDLRRTQGPSENKRNVDFHTHIQPNNSLFRLLHHVRTAADPI
jgi:hypothetical protein